MSVAELGMGIHPDWGMVGTLRTELADRGFATLSIQMPILAADAQSEAYPPTFPEAAERIAEAVAPRFLGVHDYHGQRQILADLREALLFQYRIRLHYTPARRDAETYLFDPYTLLFTQGALYLGGYAHNRQAMRLFLIDRVQGVELTRERFEVPENFSAEQLTGGAFGLVREEPLAIKIKIAPDIAHLATELEIDVVDEGVAWFRERGSTPCQLELKVNYSPAQAGV